MGDSDLITKQDKCKVTFNPNFVNYMVILRTVRKKSYQDTDDLVAYYDEIIYQELLK